MKNIFNNILNSFKNGSEGYSSRKLTAFIITFMVILVHIKWLTLGNLSQIEMVLTIDYSFIAALFGMTTYQSIKITNSKDKPTDKSIDTPEEK